MIGLMEIAAQDIFQFNAVYVATRHMTMMLEISARFVEVTIEVNRMRLIDADALIAEYDRVHVGEPGGAR